jgi:hypothetical protein
LLAAAHGFLGFHTAVDCWSSAGAIDLMMY